MNNDEAIMELSHQCAILDNASDKVLSALKDFQSGISNPVNHKHFGVTAAFYALLEKMREYHSDVQDTLDFFTDKNAEGQEEEE